jgi:uncharacterized protein (DUF2252 family)
MTKRSRPVRSRARRATVDRDRPTRGRSSPPKQDLETRDERIERGIALRHVLPRGAHEAWKPAPHRDVIELLERSNAGRLPDLIPIRFGRMRQSPFAFLRGSAAVMAHDLATLPITGVRVQACGDCHLANFGLFATPERRLVFDVNDFDETLPAPWEWDLKRLCASAAVAARASQLSDEDARDVVRACALSYRERLRAYSRMSPLEVWYARLEARDLIEQAPNAKTRARRKALAKEAQGRIAENVFPKITTEADHRRRIVDQPPLIFHVAKKDGEERVRNALAVYRATLPRERRVLFDRYQLVDVAMKVIGVGSVGTRCFVGLFLSGDGEPLLLQFKEAGHSVLEPYAGKSDCENQGARVVVGQRLMQSSSDIFLGWSHVPGGRDFYVRQLRDMKLSIPLEDVTRAQLSRYAGLCGWTLARAHAKSGDGATISGYLGKSDRFDDAVAEFAIAYADQTERDHASLEKAIRSGRVSALDEEA